MRRLPFLILLLATACGNKASEPQVEGAAKAVATSGGPFLSMKVDGKLVECTDVFGAYNPKGYPKGTTIVAGEMKPDKSQPFNIALYDIQQLGSYTITNKNAPAVWAVQYVNPNSTDPFDTRLLAVNNAAGESFTLTFTKLGELDLEGTFEGTLTSDNGNTVVRITEGKFDTE
ncbi:MAG: hypothetical protein SGI94_13965 [Saprospiraceae bacterium]|nr:hypothetical protein [Saprospiraceae bacterium]